MRRVFGRERAAVGAPQHFTVDAAGQATPKGVEDRAVGLRVGLSFGIGVVDQLVHVAPEHRTGRVAQHFGCRAVDERALPAHVDSENPLAGGFEQPIELIDPGAPHRRR